MPKHLEKTDLDKFLKFIKKKGYKLVKIFVENKTSDTKGDLFIANIGFWVNLTTVKQEYMLLEHMLWIAQPPTEADLHNKNQRLQNKNFYLGKVYDLQGKIEDQGFKTKIINQMTV